jgi:aryl-alcohol dehydrogenase-like predicted oxidoreductase
MVSEIGFGTMNLGAQVTEKEAHALLSAAVERDITFIDTAEMYPWPPSANTFGDSERIVGRWLAGRPRDSVIIATKITGPHDGKYQSGGHVRHGQATLDAFNVGRAIDASLARLGSDYIDLLQFHWPDRVVPWHEQLASIDKAIIAGKVRYFGCSNETAWGVMRSIACSERFGLPRPVSTQNVLNLIEQAEYLALEETCREEGVGFIGYSPLAMGMLTGKYDGRTLPPGSRFESSLRYRNRYLTADNLSKVQAASELARTHGVSPAELALWWALTRPSVAVVLTSASRVDHLDVAVRSSALAAERPQLVM